MTLPYRPDDDCVRVVLSRNALLTPWPLRMLSRRPRGRDYPRIGSQAVAHLLQVELELREKRDSYDVDWFNAELLRRLRARIFREKMLTPGERSEFDLGARKLDFDGVDISSVLSYGKTRYREVLLEILGDLYAEEDLAGEISEVFFRRLNVSWRRKRV